MLKIIKNIGLLIAIAIIVGFFSPMFLKQEPAIQKTPINKIEIYKNAKKLYLYKNQKRYTYDIATGKNSGNKQKIGDNRTPLGKFKIVSIEKSDQWSYDFEDDDKGPIVGAYGPWFIRLQGLDESNKKWKGIGIHGTHRPDSIGTNDTHGCIRMTNNKVTELKKKIRLGQIVEIKE